MIQDSKLQMRLKWGVIQSVHPDHDGVVSDVIVRYSLLKPGPEPYMTSFTKKGPFKSKLCSVQNLALVYSCEEQEEDRHRNLKDAISGSVSVDMVGGEKMSKEVRHKLQYQRKVDGEKDRQLHIVNIETLYELESLTCAQEITETGADGEGNADPNPQLAETSMQYDAAGGKASEVPDQVHVRFGTHDPGANSPRYLDDDDDETTGVEQSKNGDHPSQFLGFQSVKTTHRNQQALVRSPQWEDSAAE